MREWGTLRPGRPMTDPAALPLPSLGLASLTLVQDRMETLEADVLVTDATSELQMTRGLGAALRTAAGIEVHVEAVASAPARVGSVVVTQGGKLRAPRVFHAVLIDANIGGEPSASAVETVVKAVLLQAARDKIRSLCLPLFTSGVGDGRIGRGLQVTLEALESAAGELRKRGRDLTDLSVRIVARSDEEMAEARAAATRFLPAAARAEDEADTAAAFLKSLLGE